MKTTTSIYKWYKKVTNLVAKNIEKINMHEFTIEVSFMDIRESNRSITINVFYHAKDDCRLVNKYSITNYNEDKDNKKSFKDFKNFLEKIETSFKSFYTENNDKN